MKRVSAREWRTLARTLSLMLALAAAMPIHAQQRAAAAVELRVTPRDYGTADYRWLLRDLADNVVRLDQFRGRVMFVNLWATWCPPCTEEMASIQALHDSLSGNADVAFLMVSPERRGPVEKFIRRRGHTFPVYLEATRMPGAFGLRALPTTFVIDRNGRIVLAHRGAANWNTPRMREFLRELDSTD